MRWLLSSRFCKALALGVIWVWEANTLRCSESFSGKALARFLLQDRLEAARRTLDVALRFGVFCQPAVCGSRHSRFE